MTQLLQSGPHLKILASSRESLRVSGEATYPVPALAVPDPGKAVALPAMTQYEAVLLFVDRAMAALPSFQLTEQNAAAVADICQQLDGIPLALELAAARVRTLSVETIAARLGDRFRLLAGGNRTAMPRQQTLRALIDWSYDLLTENERALLRRLAVFAGGWTLEGAEAVGAAGSIGEHDVVDLLSNLVEKSLVNMEAEGQRYRLVETVRQYAQDKLDDAGEADAARSRHLAFYLAMAERASPELVGPNQGMWLARLDLEGENLLAAHAWCDQAQDGAELGLRLVFAIKLLHVLPRTAGVAASGHARSPGALRGTAENRGTMPRAAHGRQGQPLHGPLRRGAGTAGGGPLRRAGNRRSTTPCDDPR